MRVRGEEAIEKRDTYFDFEFINILQTIEVTMGQNNLD